MNRPISIFHLCLCVWGSLVHQSPAYDKDLVIDEDFELLVLASDGLWDVVPNEDAVSLATTEEPEAAARKLTDTAFTRGSADNITCIVVKFHHEKSEHADLK